MTTTDFLQRERFLTWLKSDHPEADITLKNDVFLNSVTRVQFEAWKDGLSIGAGFTGCT